MQKFTRTPPRLPKAILYHSKAPSFASPFPPDLLWSHKTAHIKQLLACSADRGSSSYAHGVDLVYSAYSFHASYRTFPLLILVFSINCIQAAVLQEIIQFEVGALFRMSGRKRAQQASSNIPFIPNYHCPRYPVPSVHDDDDDGISRPYGCHLCHTVLTRMCDMM
uniref:Uncharacterized protein n=1 Tax=Rhipicephalus zambeziensis TaxID=60191 RepID=A0A224YHZ4_9ACAR